LAEAIWLEISAGSTFGGYVWPWSAINTTIPSKGKETTL
jgi:hypothetical protein